MKYVIIGSSIAAVGAVEAIRKNDMNGDILIVSNENHQTYSRPLISYLLQGKTNLEKMRYRDNDFYTKNNCKFLLSKVVKIEPDKKQIVIEDNSFIFYDKLLVATGSAPFVPPMKGLEKVLNKFTFTTLDDAMALDSVLTNNTKVLIVGSGLIGLKCAEGISNKAKITCVDLSPKVLSSILDDESSEIIKRHLEENQIQFYLNSQVIEFSKTHAMLKGGELIEFDVVVLAVGVHPNIALVKDAGGETNRGILIDEKCRTSLPDIYAAGDCCESIDAITGERKVLALLPNAYMQGECAGMNMSGVFTTFDKAIPMNAMSLFGKHIITAGIYKGDFYYECDDKNYKKLYYSDNKLNGYILMGNVEKAGIYTHLIREKIPLASLDFDLICIKPGLMAFSKETRAEKLGGVSQ